MYKAVKRLLDFLISFLAICGLSWLLIIIALIIKIEDNGNILFKQKRIGLNKKEFYIYKFRTMKTTTPKDVPTHLLENPDSYITNIGKFLRKSSLDELPQLFNILKGEMSLVGPRPERPFFVEKFREEIPRYMVKHQVRPGLTGWAQVNGYRGDTSIRKRIECDLYYIENWSVGFDIKIMFLTIFKGFINKNAY